MFNLTGAANHGRGATATRGDHEVGGREFRIPPTPHSGVSQGFVVGFFRLTRFLKSILGVCWGWAKKNVKGLVGTLSAKVNADVKGQADKMAADMTAAQEKASAAAKAAAEKMAADMKATQEQMEAAAKATAEKLAAHTGAVQKAAADHATALQKATEDSASAVQEAAENHLSAISKAAKKHTAALTGAAQDVADASTDAVSQAGSCHI